MSDELFIGEIMLRRPIDKRSYLNDVPAVKYLIENKSIKLSERITFFVGENGLGKSTLIEAIAIAYGFNPEGGTKNFCFETVKAHSELWEHLTIAKNRFARDGFFLRAESFFNVASAIDRMDEIPAAAPSLIGSYGGISLHEQSHGESFLALVQNRFGGNGVYILDEPEAALSPMRLMTLIAEILALVDKDSQFIIATHSPMLMAIPHSEILEISEYGIKSVCYKETEHYQVTKRFLESPERMIKYLTEE